MLKRYEKQFSKVKKNITDTTNALLKSNELIVKSLKKCDSATFDKAKSHIKNISKKTTDIDQEIITILALHSPEARDLRTMVAYLKITNEILRASTNTRGFIKGFCLFCKDIKENSLKEYVVSTQALTVEILSLVLQMIQTDCVDDAQDIFEKVLAVVHKIDELSDNSMDIIMKNINKIDDFKKYHKFLSSLKKSEKVADRAVSIAHLLIFANIGGELHR